MPITSRKNFRMLLLFIGALIFPMITEAENLSRIWLFKTSKSENICIQAANRRLTEFRSCSGRPKKIAADKNAVSKFANADEIHPLFGINTSNTQELLILTRTRSTSHRSTKYCGAGYEDYIVLVTIASGKMSYQSEFLVQSCLKNLSLESDKTDHPLDSMDIDYADQTLKFRWLTDAEGTYQQVSINPSNHRLNISIRTN